MKNSKKKFVFFGSKIPTLISELYHFRVIWFKSGVNPSAGKFESLRIVKKLISSMTMVLDHIKDPDQGLRWGNYTPFYV